MEVHEDIPEYKTYRTLVNHLLEGLADIEEGRVQDFEKAMKEIRKELGIWTGHNLLPVEKENIKKGMHSLNMFRN